MKHLLRPVFSFLFPIFCFLLSLPVAAQSLSQDLARFAETPAAPGYEQALAAEIRGRLGKLSPQRDNLGNLYVTLGSRETSGPHRLIVAPMDEPGYLVSGITDDGYLRVQRLPQTAPHAFFDLLHAAQPVVIHTRKDKWVPGVMAGLSTHLQPGRQNAPRGAHPDEIYIDIGASSAAEVHQAGVDLLDPIALDRKLYAMGFGRMTAPAVGDRFGCAALVELLRRIDPAKLRGRLTVAFVTQQWADGRGLDRLLQQIKPDEMIYVGRMLPRRVSVAPATGAAAGRVAAVSGLPRLPQGIPGSGVSIGAADPEAALTGLALELKQLAEANKIPVAADFSAPLPRSRYAPSAPESAGIPQRFAHLGIAVKWPTTPAEFVAYGDLQNLVALLKLYAQGSTSVDVASPASTQVAPGIQPPHHVSHNFTGFQLQTTPPATEILKTLVETYGVSGHEGMVREVITRLLPPWAKPETDASGNLILRFASKAVPSEPQPGKKPARIAFVAHMDEIGYVVRSISADGILEVQSRGGSISEFFLGHAVWVHTASGTRPGVLELPLGWDRPGFEWPRGPQSGEISLARVDVGARSAAEVEQLSVKVGDPITVPKKYRRLLGTRANGRSFDDRVGCAALVAAAWALGPDLPGRDVTFLWSTEEEVGLLGAQAAAQRLAGEGLAPEYVFAVDTFVSSDSPLESKRFADAPIGKGFVVRAVDNSNITSRELADRLVALARTNHIPAQYGVTGGGNDGATFLRYGSIDVPIAWPLRYSHSPGEVIDTRDLDALARIVAVIARSW